jgi:hypothetical protein
MSDVLSLKSPYNKRATMETAASIIYVRRILKVDEAPKDGAGITVNPISSLSELLVGEEILVIILTEASSGMGQVFTSITTSSKVTRHRQFATAVAIVGKFSKLSRYQQQHQIKAGQFPSFARASLSRRPETRARILIRSSSYAGSSRSRLERTA